MMFTILFSMKHLFMYVAPVFFIHILVGYCLGKLIENSMETFFLIRETYTI